MTLNKCLILEDEPLYQELLKSYLQQALPEIAPPHRAHSVAEATELIGAHQYDLALVDIQLPDGSGCDFLLQLNKHQVNCLTVVVTNSDEEATVFKCLRAGANGYLLKNEPGSSLVNKLKEIISGNPPLSGPIAAMIMQHFAPERAEESPLTEREAEILGLLSKGLNRRETAQLLALSPHTIAGHCKSIYRKLGVSSKAEATRRAIELGLS